MIFRFPHSHQQSLAEPTTGFSTLRVQRTAAAVAQQAVTFAADEATVVRLADEYLRGVPASAWVGVPAGYRPQRILSGEDVEHWTVRLAAAAHPAPSEVRFFLLNALTRLRELRPLVRARPLE
jgi:hypothetical protein